MDATDVVTGVEAGLHLAKVQIVEFTIPLVPPSVNNYVRHTRRGRHYVTAEGIAFKKAVAIFARGQSVAPARESERRRVAYRLEAWVYLGKGARGDGDNFWKCIADGLTEAGVIHSDAAVSEWLLYKWRGENPRTEVRVTRLCRSDQDAANG